MRAKFIHKTYDTERHPVLTYEYRGYHYDVIDYGWRGGEPLSWQHNYEQAHIDQLVEDSLKPKTGYVETPAEVGLEMFFASFENVV